jgi:protein-L-isoaspartate(D-aspartate) O-methyltransferase
LVDQLAIGGIMVIPVGPERGDQVLIKLTRQEDGSVSPKVITDVRFVPLVEGALPEGEGRPAPRRMEN